MEQNLSRREPDSLQNSIIPPPAKDSLDLKPGRADSNQYKQQADKEGPAFTDLALLLKCRPEVIALGKSQTGRAPTLVIASSVKTAVLEQPLNSSFGGRHTGDGICPHNELVSPRQMDRNDSPTRELTRGG